MRAWYVLYCTGQDADRISNRVRSMGVNVFRPTLVKVAPRRDCNSFRITEKPMFPNYLFLEFDIEQIHTSFFTDIPGAVSFIHFGAGPCRVPQYVIDGLKNLKEVLLNFLTISAEFMGSDAPLLNELHRISSITNSTERQAAFTTLLNSRKPKSVWN